MSRATRSLDIDKTYTTLNIIGGNKSVKSITPHVDLDCLGDALFHGTVKIEELLCSDVDGNIVGTLFGNLYGDAFGNLYGNVFGDLTGNVYGNLYGGLLGDVTGNLYGDVFGNLFGNIYGNAIGNVIGNIQGYVTGNVNGNVTGNLNGNVVGDVTGNVVGDVTGNLSGNVTGDVLGNVTGNVTGDVTGNITGDLTGNVTGDIVGNVTGNVTGDLTGNVQGDVVGNITGNITGDLTGNITGDIVGNVIGNVTGDLTGNVTGDVTGNVTGDLTGNVTGDVTGNVTGDLTGNIIGDVNGNVIGNLSGNVTGDVVGNVMGNVTGDVTGNLTGNINGNPFVSGNLTVCGNLYVDHIFEKTNGVYVEGVLFNSGNITGNLTGNIYGDTFIDGNLVVSGTTITFDSLTVLVEDSLIGLAANNVSDLVDIGVYGTYNGNLYSGFVRDASDGKYKIFDGLTVSPTTVVDFNNANLSNLCANTYFGNLIGDVSGNIYGNVSGNLYTDYIFSLSGGNINIANVLISNGNIYGNLCGNLTTDYITNKNSGVGTLINGVLIKDGNITGNLCGNVISDYITNKTSGEGTLINGVLIKNGNVSGNLVGSNILIGNVLVQGGNLFATNIYGNLCGNIMSDYITNKTSGEGTLINGVLVKDGNVSGNLVGDNLLVGNVLVQGANLFAGYVCGNLISDFITEKNSGHGTFINNVVVKAGNLTGNLIGNLFSDNIFQKTSGMGTTINGVLVKDGFVCGNIKTDLINEKTLNAGVTVDGVLMKDSDVYGNDTCMTGHYDVEHQLGENISAGSVVSISTANGKIVKACTDFKAVQSMITSGIDTSAGTFDRPSIIQDTVTGDYYLSGNFTGTIIVAGNAYTPVTAGNRDIIIIKANSSGAVQWGAHIAETSGNNVNDQSGFDFLTTALQYHNGYLYVMFSTNNGTGPSSITWKNSDVTVGEVTSGLGFANIYIGRISSAGFWLPTAIKITNGVNSGLSDHYHAPGTFRVDTVNNKLYAGGQRSVGGGGGETTSFISGAGTYTIVGDAFGSGVNTRYRAFYGRIDLTSFSFEWVNGSYQAAGDIGSTATDINIDSINRVYVTMTRNNFGGAVPWNLWLTTPKTFTNGAGFAVVAYINPLSGEPYWYKSISGVSFTTFDSIFSADTRLYLLGTIGAASNANYGDLSVPSVDTVLTYTAPANTFFYLELNPTTGAIINTKYGSGSSLTAISDISPAYSFYCPISQQLYITHIYQSAGSYNYTGYIGNPFTSTTSVLLVILDRDLNLLNVRNLSSTSRKIQICNAGGVYSGVPKGYVEDGISIANGGIVRFNNEAQAVYGILTEDGLTNDRVCVAVKGIYTNSSYSFTSGSIYYYDCTTNSFTSNHVRNQQVGIAITSNSIEILPIQNDLAGYIDGNYLNINSDAVLGGNVIVDGVLKVNDIASRSSLTLNYPSVQTITYSNNAIPSASTKKQLFRVLSAVPTVPALGGAGTLTNISGPATTTATAGTVRLFDLGTFRASISDNGPVISNMWKIDINVLQSNTATTGYGIYKLIVGVMIDTTFPLPDTFSTMTYNLVAPSIIAGDTLSIYLDNTVGVFQLWYTQGAGVTSRVIQGSVEVYTTGGLL